MPKETDADYGSEQVRLALIKAAIDSYASGSTFSVREIAEAAGVNHGQVHHYFGGKDGLRRAMLEHLANEQRRRLEDAGPLPLENLLSVAASISQDDQQFIRVLARTILEYPVDQTPQRAFPIVARLQQAMLEDGVRNAEQVLGEGLARALGWHFFGEWIRTALDMSGEDADIIQNRIGTMLVEQARGDAGLK